MKKYLFMFIAGIIFLNVLTANDVSAQVLKVIRAEVPFDFYVGDKIYPAGVYRLESISQSNENLFQLRGVNKKNQQLIVTDNLYADRRQSPKLVFYRIGEKNYLTNIFMTNGVSGFSIRLSRRIESGKNTAAKPVEVAAKN